MPRKNHQPDDDFEDGEEYSKLDDEKFEAALLERRIVLLTGEITREKIGKIKGEFLELSIASPDKEIILFINSIGGDVDPGLALYDFMTVFLKAPVVGVVGAECLSMASVILQGCAKRVAAPHSCFYVHAMLGDGATVVYCPGVNDYMKRIKEALKKSHEGCIKILEKHSKMSLTEIEQIAFANNGMGTTLSAPEALKKGLIDEIAKGDKYRIF